MRVQREPEPGRQHRVSSEPCVRSPSTLLMRLEFEELPERHLCSDAFTRLWLPSWCWGLARCSVSHPVKGWSKWVWLRLRRCPDRTSFPVCVRCCDHELASLHACLPACPLGELLFLFWHKEMDGPDVFFPSRITCPLALTFASKFPGTENQCLQVRPSDFLSARNV